MRETKRCSKCGIVKPLSAFTRNRYRPSGYQSQCKMCRAEYRRKRYANRADAADYNRREVRARSQALYELARRHDDEFAALLDECREREGLPPVGVLPQGRPLATWFHCSYDVNGAPHVVTRACFTCHRRATAGDAA